MAYTKINWRSREGTNLNKYTKSAETSTTVILTNTPDVVTQEGTPVSAGNLNHMDQGIADLDQGKVDKVAGKGLSDTNYTQDEKTKLAGIANGAQVNPGVATASANGLMSASDKSRLRYPRSARYYQANFYPQRRGTGAEAAA